jgi:hypothetical protein
MTDENPQMKTHTQNPYARNPHTDEKVIQMKKSYR